MGLETWPDDGWTGLELLHPVQTRVQQLSLLGKGFLESDKSFNRPTTVELVINPAYRVYYSGALIQDLTQRIRRHQATYHTYLGSAFALAVPEFVDLVDGEPFGDIHEPFLIKGVVPDHVIASLEVSGGKRLFKRAGGMLYQAQPGRRFRGTINFIYEAKNRSFTIVMKETSQERPVHFLKEPGCDSAVALW
jgi:CRISPR-associated protein Cas5h